MTNPAISTTLTCDAVELLAMRFLIRAMIVDLSAALGMTVEDFQASLRRRCIDDAEHAELAVFGNDDRDGEDVRTQLVEVIASMVG